ncbi:MAG: hypothetical protein K2X66_08125 [Cyanobacteria bacterium]|nr:hypothetical protein [Cyanobacteriota bacterium]
MNLLQGTNPHFSARFAVIKAGTKQTIQASKESAAGVGALAGLAGSGPLIAGGSGMIAEQFTLNKADGGPINHAVVKTLQSTGLNTPADSVAQYQQMAGPGSLILGVLSGLGSHFGFKYLHKRANVGNPLGTPAPQVSTPVKS